MNDDQWLLSWEAFLAEINFFEEIDEPPPASLLCECKRLRVYHEYAGREVRAPV